MVEYRCLARTNKKLESASSPTAKTRLESYALAAPVRICAGRSEMALPTETGFPLFRASISYETKCLCETKSRG